MKSSKKNLAAAARLIMSCCLLFFISCDNASEPTETDNSSIVLETAGTGDFFQKVSVSSMGLASFESIYPVLQLQLSEGEFKNIKACLIFFEKYKDFYSGGPADDFQYKLTRRINNHSRTIEFDQHSLENNSELKSIAELVKNFQQLTFRIYSEQAEWFEVDYGFGCTYSCLQTDSVRFHASIVNTSYKNSTVYFRNKYRLQIKITGDSPVTDTGVWFPEHSAVSADTSSPGKIILAPGEEYVIKGSWDQHYFNSNNIYSQLPKGKYKAVVYLLGGQNFSGTYPNSIEFPLEIK